MIGKIKELYDDSRKGVLTLPNNTDVQFAWTKVMDVDFKKVDVGWFIDVIVVDGFVTRVKPCIDPSKKLASLTPDQRKQLAIILQSSVKVVSEGVSFDSSPDNNDLKLAEIERCSKRLMLFIDSETTGFLS